MFQNYCQPQRLSEVDVRLVVVAAAADQESLMTPRLLLKP